MKHISLILPGIISVLTVLGCQNNFARKIDITKLKPAQLDSIGFLGISIIKTYPAKNIDTNNANLYECLFGNKGDTILVFELNKKVDWDVLNEIKKEDNGAILDKEILKNPPTSTFIFVPKDFKIPKSASYIFASPTAIEE